MIFASFQSKRKHTYSNSQYRNLGLPKPRNKEERLQRRGVRNYVEGEIGRSFLAHLVHDAGLVVVSDNTKKSDAEMLLAILITL